MDNNIPCEIVSWAEVETLVADIVGQVRADRFRPDLIVAIARGGFVPARLLADHLDVFDMDSIKIEHYRGVRKGPGARLRYPLSAEVDGRTILVVDDVSDSGETFELALAHIRSRGTPAGVRTAAVHHKETSSYRPDYHAGKLSHWRWLIYPWAMTEDLRSLLSAMEPQPHDVSEFADLLEARHGIRPPPERLQEVLT
jgi:hypoxanthine phosphoribosyltransferase